MSSPLSGFTAVPNPQMLAFMPIQSYLMMYFAGAGWQIGKRKISAIPNPEFNKMSANDLLQGFTADLKESIPTLERSLQDISPLIEVLIKQYGEFAKTLLTVTPQVSRDVLFGDQGIFSPTQVGNKALIDDINKAFGGSPTQAQFLAYAKILLQQQVQLNKNKDTGINADPDRFRPSTISGLSVQQAQQQAIDKQAERERQLREKAKFSTELRKTKQPIPQVATRDLKRQKAGQSQIMERKRLIIEISQVQIRKGMDLKTKSLILRGLQQRLVNLLARYRF